MRNAYNSMQFLNDDCVVTKNSEPVEQHVLVMMFLGKHPLGRLRRRWEDYIKINLLKIGCRDLK
jgi:hypothetical protein